MSSTKRASITQNNPLKNLSQASPEPEPVTTKRDRKPRISKSKQTTIILAKEQMTWLAERCIESTKDNGIITNKTAIIRALIDTAREVGLDLTGIQDEKEITQRFKEAVKAT